MGISWLTNFAPYSYIDGPTDKGDIALPNGLNPDLVVLDGKGGTDLLNINWKGASVSYQKYNDGSLVVQATGTDNGYTAYSFKAVLINFEQVQSYSASGAKTIKNIASITTTNAAPTISQEIADQNAKEGNAFSFTVPASTFSDDGGPGLSLSAKLANGKPLPKWLKFDASTGTFSGTPADADTGTLNIAVTAKDISKATVTDTFTLNIENVNQAPKLAKEFTIPPKYLAEGQQLNFIIPKGTFTDADAGDSLTYSVSNLPWYLEFSPLTRKISSRTDWNDGKTAYWAANFPSDVTITATDKAGLSASTTLHLEFKNTPLIKGTGKADHLVGGLGADTINGGLGNDVINGSSGDDVLTGGKGNDRFEMSSPSDGSHSDFDTITDFVRGSDKIVFYADQDPSLSTYRSLFGLNDLSDNFIVEGPGVTPDANDFLSFDPQTHTLYYDADGSGSTNQKLPVCKLVDVVTLSSADLAVL